MAKFSYLFHNLMTKWRSILFNQFSQKARGFEPGRRMELGSDESTVLRKLLQQPQQPPI